MTTLLEEILAQPLVEDRLVPVEPPGRQRLLPPDVPPPELRDLPALSIGTPYLERVPQPAPEIVESAARTVLTDSLLFLVVMACSFHPILSKVTVAWARFQAEFLPDEHGHLPQALDLYPKKIEREIKVTTKLGLSPSLKFAEIELSIGEFSRQLEYPKVEPTISAARQLQSKPIWDFFAGKDHPIHGDKMLCALVRVPRELSRLSLSLAATADLNYRGMTLPSWLGGKRPDQDAEPKQITLWEAER